MRSSSADSFAGVTAGKNERCSAGHASRAVWRSSPTELGQAGSLPGRALASGRFPPIATSSRHQDSTGRWLSQVTFHSGANTSFPSTYPPRPISTMFT
jgi:hypothetical protein